MKTLRRVALTVVVPAILVATFGEARAQVFGGLDAARGGACSLKSGAFMVNIRNAILEAVPCATFSESGVLTSSYLGSIDVLVMTSATGTTTVITPLTAAEQSALDIFVRNGGRALISTDNSIFAGALSDPANESVIDPFGMDAAGTLSGNQAATATVSHVVLNGPHGTVSVLSGLFPGWFDNLGPYAQSIARLNANLAHCIAVIEPSAITPGSGAVVLTSDTNFFMGFTFPTEAMKIVKNSMVFVGATDTTPPTITAPAALALDADAGTCARAAANVALGSPIVNDNCGAVTSANDGPATYPVGMTTVTWTATDAAGNIATATQVVTVEDHENPTITAPPPANFQCVIAVPPSSPAQATSADNCGEPTMSLVETSNGGAGSTASPLVLARTFTATDAAGNTAQATQTITVVDDTPPSIIAPVDVAASLGNNVDLGTPVTSDNCDVASVTNDAPVTFPEGTTTVTWTVTDTSDNQASDTQLVTITAPSSSAEVVVATNSVWLKEHAVVHSGNVSVRDASSGPTLDSQVELAVGQSVSTPAGFGLEANRIHVKQGAVVASDVFYNQLTNNGTITGAQVAPLSLPGTTLPAFQGAPAGTQDITVNANQTITLTAGAYRDILVKLSGTILFAGGGSFALRSLDTGDRAKLLFDAPSTILIEGKLDTDQHSYVGPATGSGIGAADIVFYVAAVNGNNGNFGATPKAAQLGLHNTVLANVYAPNGTLWLRQGTTATGAFLGRDVIVGEQVDVTLASAFETGGPVVKAGPAIQDDRQATEATPGIELSPSPMNPVAYALFQNFPDPFNPTTTFQFDLPEPADVTLEVIDVTGRRVALVIAHRRYEIGRHRVVFGARGLGSGLYFYRIKAGSFTSSKKMLLLK